MGLSTQLLSIAAIFMEFLAFCSLGSKGLQETLKSNWRTFTSIPNSTLRKSHHTHQTKSWENPLGLLRFKRFIAELRPGIGGRKDWSPRLSFKICQGKASLLAFWFIQATFHDLLTQMDTCKIFPTESSPAETAHHVIHIRTTRLVGMGYRRLMLKDSQSLLWGINVSMQMYLMSSSKTSIASTFYSPNSIHQLQNSLSGNRPILGWKRRREGPQTLCLDPRKFQFAAM